jgi:hypothetical protein
MNGGGGARCALVHLRATACYRRAGRCHNPRVGRISLLSVVRERGHDRYMAVEQILGDRADCAWFEGSERVTRRFPIASLEVVPALGADDERWREAFRAATHKKVG